MLSGTAATSLGQVFNYDTGEILSGTENIIPQPGVQLGGLNLSFGALDNMDLRNGGFSTSWLLATDFRMSDLRGANFSDAIVEYTKFGGADLAAATFHNTFFSNPDFSGADLSAARLERTTLSGNFQNARFAGARLEEATFYGGIYSNADFTNAVIDRATFSGAQSISAEQFQSTANYRMRDLRDMRFVSMPLSDWNLREQNLQGAEFVSSNLARIDLSGANLEDSSLYDDVDLTDANLRGANLRGASLGNKLTGAEFDGAFLGDTTFRDINFAEQQLRSTASFQQKVLRGIGFLVSMDLSRWNFEGQDLSYFYCHDCKLIDASMHGAQLSRADLRGTNFENADLIGVDLSFAALASSNLTATEMSAAEVIGTDLDSVLGLTKEQLYSTASYNGKDLFYIGLASLDLSKWDFSGQNLTLADFNDAKVADAVFLGASIKGARFRNVIDLNQAVMDRTTVYDQWTIFPDGFDPVARGLTFAETERGDFNADGFLDEADVDLLTRASLDVRIAGFRTAVFDQDSDLDLSEQDRQVWVKELKRTWYGDSNFDGLFDSSDLVIAFQAGQYEDGTSNNSGWRSGDWDGDADFTTSDLVLAFQDGGYEQVAKESVFAVPEPSPSCAFLVPMVLLAVRTLRVGESTFTASGRC